MLHCDFLHPILLWEFKCTGTFYSSTNKWCTSGTFYSIPRVRFPKISHIPVKHYYSLSQNEQVVYIQSNKKLILLSSRWFLYVVPLGIDMLRTRITLSIWRRTRRWPRAWDRIQTRLCLGAVRDEPAWAIRCGSRVHIFHPPDTESRCSLRKRVLRFAQQLLGC